LNHISPHLSLPQPPATQNFTPRLESNALPRSLKGLEATPFESVNPLTGEVFFLDIVTLPPCADPEKTDYWLQVYHNDLIVKKPARNMKKPTPGPRGKIFQFSDASSRRLGFVCRNSGFHIKTHFCCTYPGIFPLNGREVKRHLERFIKRLKRRFGVDNFYYLWCLEFQQRGAPHIHFYSSIPETRENHLFLVQAWLESMDEPNNDLAWSFHAHPNNFFPWEMKDGSYPCKEYIQKSVQKETPEAFHSVGRFWGHSHNMKPDFNTVAPADHDEALQDIHKAATRILAKAHERKIDHFKTFSLLFQERLTMLFPGVERADVPAHAKKQISLALKIQKPHKTHRKKPKTNLRNRAQSFTLPYMAPVFYDVCTRLMSPAGSGSFTAFSRFVDSCTIQDEKLTAPPDSTPPATQDFTLF
jgi:hypothetical protein